MKNEVHLKYLTIKEMKLDIGNFLLKFIISDREKNVIDYLQHFLGA